MEYKIDKKKYEKAEIEHIIVKEIIDTGVNGPDQACAKCGNKSDWADLTFIGWQKLLVSEAPLFNCKCGGTMMIKGIQR